MLDRVHADTIDFYYVLELCNKLEEVEEGGVYFYKKYMENHTRKTVYNNIVKELVT